VEYIGIIRDGRTVVHEFLGSGWATLLQGRAKKKAMKNTKRNKILYRTALDIESAGF